MNRAVVSGLDLPSGLKIARALIGVHSLLYFVGLAAWPADFMVGSMVSFLVWAPWTGMVASAALIPGFAIRLSIPVIWLMFVLFFTHMPLAREIHLSYLCLVLLFFFLISFARSMDDEFCRDLARAMLWIYGLSYSYMGASKLMSSEWMSGNNLEVFFEFVRSDFLRNELKQIPESMLRVLAYAIAIVETVVLPAVLWRRTRYLALAAMISLHLAIGFTDLRYVSLGMLIYSLTSYFVFRSIDRVRSVA